MQVSAEIAVEVEVAAITVAESKAEQRATNTKVKLMTDMAEEENQGAEVKSETEPIVGSAVEKLAESRAKAKILGAEVKIVIDLTA